MTKWNLKNASEKEKEIYRQEFEKVYQKELQRRTPVVPASKSVSVDTPKTAAQKQNRAAVKSGGPVLMPMAQKERQREAQQRTAQQFQQFGMDPTAIVGQQAGQIVGNWLKDKAAETGIDPGKSKAAYIAEKGLGGAATSVEGAYNNILDNARAQVNAQLTNGYVTDTGVNLRDMQNFWAAVFGGKHAQYAQDTQAADKAVAEQLPAAADRLRSTKAAEYAQGLDEKYGATGLWKVGGDLAAGVGGMLPSIGVNAVTGGTLGLPYIMSSAAGNAAVQARAYGADEDTALVYGLLSGATEGATEKIVGGIPGLGGGWMDKVIQRVAGSSAGRRAVKQLSDVFGEGLEEALSELIGSQLEKMYLNREDWRSGGEIAQDTLYSALLGALTSAAMNAPGDIRTRRTGAKINALGGANDVISEGLRAPADGDVDGNADRLSLAAELARRATDGAKLSNADLGELYQMNARTGQQLFTLPMLEQRADQRAAEAEAAQDAKKDAASAIKTDSVTGEPASIGDAATSLNTIIPQKQGDSNPLPVIRMPMAQQAMPASKAEAKATNAQLLEKLRGSIPEIQGMQPVAEITGKEFAKNAEKNLVQQVGDYFRTLGNKVFRRGLGEVVLDERGVKDSMAHGIGRRKAAAFAAVPQVIAQGRQIDTQQNWKGRGYDTLVFAAPVKVGADTNYIAAVVTKSTENNRYYLHEVVDQNGNIIYQKKDAANAIKTDSVTGEPASIGGATTSLDNIVPQSGENATDGGRFLPPVAGDTAQSGARRNAEADTPGVILPPMKGKPDTTAAPGDGLQLNANAEKPGTAAGNEKSKRIQNRRENAFVDRVGDALSVPKGARREYLKPLADAMAAEIKQNGRVSEATASEVFNAAYDRGIVVMDEYYNQYKELKDELRGNELTLDSESRSSREYKDMRTQYFGDLKLTNEGGTPIDVKYAELAERYPELFDAELSAPLDQLERIGEVARSIRKTGVELDAYYGDDAADFKAYARNGFDDAVEQLTRDVKGVQRYEADQAAQRQAREQKTSVPAPVSTDALKAAYETAKRLRRQADKITANELLTEQDSRTVDKLLRGDIDPEDVKGENRGGILRVYAAKKAVQDSLAPVKEYNAQRRAGLASEAAQDIAKSDAWKDKPGGLFYSTETMERNMRDIVPDRTEARALTEKYFTPVHANEAKATRWKNEQRARIAALNLTQAESEYLQVYGELQGAEAAAAMGNKRSEAELELLSRTAEEMRKKYGSRLDMDKINRGLELFRKEYDAIFEQMNEAYMRNGYAPVEYRSGYFPHFTDSQPDGLLNRIAEKLGWNTRKDELPTDIAGLTYTFRPGRKYNPNAKQRTGFETTYDALKGFDRYIETAADVIFHTEDIQRLRALEDAVRFKNSEKGIKQEVQDIRADESLTEEQRESRVAELYSKGKSHLSHFVQELNEYTNKLAGKKSIHDRGVEADAGRGIYQMMSNLENRVAANMVAVNPGSWLTNFIPITQASAECSTGSLVRAARETAKAYYKDDGFADTSVFLTNRRGSSPLSMTKLQKLSETLTKPMAYIDDFTSNVVTRAKYYDNIKAGMDASSAMQEADRYAASLMADRSKGALPTVFERKNPLTRLLTMYQVEVNNQLRHLFKDLPDDLKEKGMAALVAGLMKYTIGAYLFNDLYEKLVGRRPALDFLGIANEAIGDYTGYQLPNTVDAAQQLISSEGVDFTTQRRGAVQATASLAENVAQELPFVGGVLGGGRVPISSALPDMGNLVSNAVGLASGEKDAGRALQGIGKELAKPAFYILPPLGGGQLKKAFEGITTVANGGQFGYDSQGRETMKFPVENPTLGTYAQAALFGPYSLPMAQDYVDSGFRAKSAKYTEAYRAATGAGVEGEKFRAMMDAMDADGNGTLSAGEVTQGLEGHGLTPEQKAAVWQVYASDEAKAKYKAAQAVGAGEQYILMLPMLDADKNGSVSTDELYAAMDSQGLDAGQQAALWYAYAGSGQRMKYEKAEEYGLGRIYAEMLRYADTNNSGTLNKDELRAYLDSTGLNRAQKAVLFELASTAKNPYE
nr:MAG TPA: PLASMODIAL SPECIFIC LAV1-2 PROTEIN KDA CALCIUM BINDING PROTEIN.0A [Caudoviricetes sp.]